MNRQEGDHPARPRLAALILMVSLAAGSIGCGGGQTPDNPPWPVAAAPSGQRVVIVGIDSASWEDLEHLLAAGKLPNFLRLKEEGAWGILKSFHPTASAIIWTSIATGKVPDKHGIRSFVAPLPTGEMVPVSSNMRRVRAVWNILSDAGIRVGVVGWWVSWPAEKVNGFYCSDYTWPLKKDREGYARGKDEDLALSRRTYPEEILEEFQPFLVTPENLSATQRMDLGLDRIPPTSNFAVADILCKDKSYMDGGLYLLDRYQPDFFAVYLEGIDAFKHIFWPSYKAYRDWRYLGAQPPPSRGERAAGEVLEIQYRNIDRFLGRLREQAGPETTILVVSDHGYGDNPGNNPVPRTYEETIRPNHWHDLDGLILVWGGPIRRGIEMGEHSVLDITPTILALLGLSVAEDMDGEVIEEAFRQEWLDSNRRRKISTYETEPEKPGNPIPSPYDREQLERLRSLGYIGP